MDDVTSFHLDVADSDNRWSLIQLWIESDCGGLKLANNVGRFLAGVNITPILGVIGAAGFVLAFALQSTLGNFASGIMIMIYKPFDVGDSISAAGIMGVEKTMNLTSTIINTFDNKLVIVPNNNIWGGVITNINGSSTRRVDLIFRIAYGDDAGFKAPVDPGAYIRRMGLPPAK